MLPITLGANIGTTCTAFLASLVTESTNAVQIAVCHFLFNITGVILLYPVPRIRQLPIQGAKRLGALVVHYKWFSVLYTIYMFVLLPLIIFGISFLFNREIVTSLLGTGCLMIVGCSTYKGFQLLEKKQQTQQTQQTQLATRGGHRGQHEAVTVGNTRRPPWGTRGGAQRQRPRSAPRSANPLKSARTPTGQVCLGEQYPTGPVCLEIEAPQLLFRSRCGHRIIRGGAFYGGHLLG